MTNQPRPMSQQRSHTVTSGHFPKPIASKKTSQGAVIASCCCHDTVRHPATHPLVYVRTDTQTTCCQVCCMHFSNAGLSTKTSTQHTHTEPHWAEPCYHNIPTLYNLVAGRLPRFATLPRATKVATSAQVCTKVVPCSTQKNAHRPPQPSEHLPHNSGPAQADMHEQAAGTDTLAGNQPSRHMHLGPF